MNRIFIYNKPVSLRISAFCTVTWGLLVFGVIFTDGAVKLQNSDSLKNTRFSRQWMQSETKNVFSSLPVFTKHLLVEPSSSHPGEPGKSEKQASQSFSANIHENNKNANQLKVTESEAANAVHAQVSEQASPVDQLLAHSKLSNKPSSSEGEVKKAAEQDTQGAASGQADAAPTADTKEVENDDVAKDVKQPDSEHQAKDDKGAKQSGDTAGETGKEALPTAPAQEAESRPSEIRKAADQVEQPDAPAQKPQQNQEAETIATPIEESGAKKDQTASQVPVEKFAEKIPPPLPEPQVVSEMVEAPKKKDNEEKVKDKDGLKNETPTKKKKVPTATLR